VTRAALRALLLSLGVAGCALVSPSTGGNATACQLVPLAPEIATHVREALAAAHSGDGEAMKEAAQKARDIADRILAVTQSHEPGASPDPLLLSLLQSHWWETKRVSYSARTCRAQRSWSLSKRRF
jgi:hypothetical protein